MGRWWRISRALAVGATLAAGSHAATAAAPNGMALTLSGLPSAPRAERALAVDAEPIGIGFRAPLDTDLKAVHLLWRRASGCAVSLHADDGGSAGAALAVAPVPAGTGWRASAISAPLTAGARYHLMLRCERGSRARLAYVIDRARAAATTDAWRLELPAARGEAPGGASPLFALELADGSWWGYPYRAARRPLRVCGAREVATLFTPARVTEVAGIELAVRAGSPRAAVAYTLAPLDGAPLLAGTLVRGPEARSRLVPTASGEAVTLLPGVAYVVRLRASGRGAGCLALDGLTTDLDLGSAATGFETIGVTVTEDGGTSWRAERVATLAGRLSTRAERCGNGRREGHEACDGTADDACPGRCTAACTCGPLPAETTSTTTTSTTSSTTRPPTTATTSTTSTTSSTARPPTTATTTSTTSSTTRPPTTATTTSSTTTRPPTTATTTTTTVTVSTAAPTTTTSTTLAARRYRSIYTSGYLGVYDPATIPVWPQRLGVILGGPDVQGPLIAQAKQVAAAAGNTDARFVFYLNLTSLDSKCNCFESRFYQGLATAHADWFLRDASGNRISTFVTQYGAGRLWAVDIGNPAFIDAWADTVLAEAARHGWDGVWADNILRGNFYDWSAWPVNPRTGARYTTAEYRQDTLAALQRLRTRLDAQGKMLIGNYGSAWEPDTLADPVVQQQIVAMHGVEVEDCVYTFGGTPHTETMWINQLRYLDFANRRGVLTQCRGGNGTIGDAGKRDYILASYLLTKEGFSNVAQLNGLNAWWSGLEVDLGNPRGGFGCLDPSTGLQPTASCPSTGKIYVREWERGRVLVNPTAGTTVTVPLGETMLRGTSRVTSVTLGPRSGVVLVRP